jgi:hypothetical protein
VIEKIFRRIADRNLLQSESATSALAASTDAKSYDSQSAGSDPFSTSYPAPSSHRLVYTAADAPNAWAQAKAAYIQRCIQGHRISKQPAYFSNWGSAHLAVAHMLWADHERLQSCDAMIYCGDALLAVVQAKKSKLLINPLAYQSAAPLSIQALPLGQAAKTADVAEYQACAKDALLWFFGQVDSRAPDVMPFEIGAQLIQLRRIPPVEPAALEMRHLALIHLFSGGALSFSQLQMQLSEEYAQYLCADLASLFCTGTLRLLASPP